MNHYFILPDACDAHKNGGGLAPWCRTAYTAVMIRSPCINVCEIERRSALCRGCLRTIDEIMAWPSASEAVRAALVADLASRRLPRRRWFA